MKTIKLIMAILIALLCFTSCSSEDNEPEENLTPPRIVQSVPFELGTYYVYQTFYDYTKDPSWGTDYTQKRVSTKIILEYDERYKEYKINVDGNIQELKDNPVGKSQVTSWDGSFTYQLGYTNEGDLVMRWITDLSVAYFYIG